MKVALALAGWCTLVALGHLATALIRGTRCHDCNKRFTIPDTHPPRCLRCVNRNVL